MRRLIFVLFAVSMLLGAVSCQEIMCTLFGDCDTLNIGAVADNGDGQ